nr:MBL fold metallo-hydrolase [Lachnospiraceae bacterium]
NPNESKDVDGLEFETVMSYNPMKPFHRKNAGWVGYIFKVDGMRIYVAGDTDATKEARAVRCDVALIPIGGTYTMDAKQAAVLVNDICPKVVIPIHYGSIVGKPTDGQVFAENVKEPIKVEFKIEF